MRGKNKAVDDAVIGGGLNKYKKSLRRLFPALVTLKSLRLVTLAAGPLDKLRAYPNIR